MARWLADTTGDCAPPVVASLPKPAAQSRDAFSSRSCSIKTTGFSRTAASSTAAPPSPEKVVAKRASWENAVWEESSQGKPREFRKKTFFGSLWPKPSHKMLMEVEARGC